MNDLYDRVYSDTEKNIIQSIFQKLTFAPSISLYKMARIALENELGKDQCDALIAEDQKNKDVKFQEEINKSYRRLNNILSCFAVNSDYAKNANKPDDANKSPKDNKPVRKNKKYDIYLLEKQVAIYDDVALRVGFPIAEKSSSPLFEGILPLSLINSACSLEKKACPNIKSKRGRCNNYINCQNCKNCKNYGKCAECAKCLKQGQCNDCFTSKLTYDSIDIDDNIDIELLTKYAPYCYYGERDGVMFIEFIIYQAIYSTKYHREVAELSKLLNGSADTKAINKWLAPVFKKIDSVEMYQTCVNTFFEIFYEYIYVKYEKLADEYIRMLLLPEEYAHMKDAFNAAEKYQENQLSKIIDHGSWYDINRAFEIWNTTDSVQYLIFHVMPQVWKILIDGHKNASRGYAYLNSLESDSVAFYCRLIRDYIYYSLEDSKKLLKECLKPRS